MEVLEKEVTEKDFENKELIINYIKSQSGDKHFKTLMLSMLDKYGVSMFNLSGIGEQLDINKAIKKMVEAQSVANGSIDSNANAGATTAVTIMHEISKPNALYQSYYRLWKWLKKNRSLETANQFVEAQLTGAFYVNDMHYVSYPSPYCYNHSCLNIAMQGLVGIDSKNDVKPPKYLRSYFDIIEAYLLIAGNSTAGATGISNLLVVASVFLKKMILNNYTDSHVHLKSEEDCWTYFKEELTSFIYRLNQACRGNQSLFTNISIYDDNFLSTIIPETQLIIDDKIYSTDLETVRRVQDIYINVMNEESDRVVHTFPVTTGCVATKFNKETGKNEILDQEFLKYLCKSNEKTGFISIYDGDTATLSSCCFDGNQFVKIEQNGIPVITTFYDLEKKGFKHGDTVSVYDKGIFRPAKFVVLNGNRPLYSIIMQSGKTITATDNHIFLTNRGELTMAEIVNNLLMGGIFLETESGERDMVLTSKVSPKISDKVYCFEMKDKSEPYFTLANGIRVGNCRLRSDKNNAFFNSFGGASDSIGSMGVVCINLPQLAMKYGSDKELFKSELKKMVVLAQEVNYAKRCLLKTSINKGHLPLYTNGYMDLSKQFATLGFIGIYECCDVLGYDITTDECLNVAKEILSSMESINDSISEQYKIPCNIEGIPGENTAIKLSNKDKILGLNKNYKMYSNQFIPLSKRCNVLDRIRLSSEMDKYCSGGSIMHLTCETKVDEDTMFNLAKAVIESGVKYFAFNYEINQCKECKTTFVGKKSTCPECGSEDVEKYMRVVGFLTKKNDWSKTRQEEDRQYYTF